MSTFRATDIIVLSTDVLHVHLIDERELFIRPSLQSQESDIREVYAVWPTDILLNCPPYDVHLYSEA